MTYKNNKRYNSLRRGNKYKKHDGEQDAEPKKKDIRVCADLKLSRKSMTAYEIRNYLLERDYPKDEIDALVETYTELGYLDDARYCSEFFDYAFRKGWSVRRAFGELEERGVSRDTIEDAFGEYQDLRDNVMSDRERAEREAVKVLRAGGIEPGDPVPEKMKGRVGRKLYSYRYNESMIYDIIESLDSLNREE